MTTDTISKPARNTKVAKVALNGASNGAAETPKRRGRPPGSKNRATKPATRARVTRPKVVPSQDIFVHVDENGLVLIHEGVVNQYAGKVTIYDRRK